MAKEESYVCSACGFVSAKWLGKCPACNQWNSFTEEAEPVKVKKDKYKENVQSISLSSVLKEENFRFSCGTEEFDRVLGGGIVKASSVLIGGEPGIGKSTLMLQLASECKAENSVIYVCGEENSSQVRQRADRLHLNLDKINIFCETKLEKIVHLIKKERPQVLILDSLQTLESEELTSIPGSVTQMRLCCMEITSVCKETGTAVFFIGHVTKEGTIAGPKIIEHIVDTVVYFEEGEAGVRIVRAVKNRFGSVDEIGIFKMEENGLKAVSDPSGFFVSLRTEEKLPPGIVYTAICEGSRSFLVEIQALVVRAKTGISRIYSDKIDSSRVARVAAILERHAGVVLSDKDIYVNVAGGVKVNDVSVELPLALALCSVSYSKSFPSKTVCFGELSLAGEIRSISFADRRLKAALNMGYERAIVPASTSSKTDKQTLKKCSKITEAVKTLLG